MNHVEAMDKTIRDIKSLNPYEEAFALLGNNYTCCLKNDLLNPIELQLQAKFYKEKVEVMIFPHPKIIQEKNLISVIKFVNEVNCYSNTYDLYGKFIMLSDTNDIAFATKLPYSYIESCSDYFFYAIQKPIEILIEVLPIIIYISTGKITYEKGVELLKEMWG